MDVACCLKLQVDQRHEPKSVLYVIFKKFYAPVLLSDWVRSVVVCCLFHVLHSVWLCHSCIVLLKQFSTKS